MNGGETNLDSTSPARVRALDLQLFPLRFPLRSPGKIVYWRYLIVSCVEYYKFHYYKRQFLWISYLKSKSPLPSTEISSLENLLSQPNAKRGKGLKSAEYKSTFAHCRDSLDCRRASSTALREKNIYIKMLLQINTQLHPKYIYMSCWYSGQFHLIILCESISPPPEHRARPQRWRL